MSRRDIFRENKLIYVHGQWKAPVDCVWGAPKCLTSKVALRQEFPHLANLFKDTLGIGDSTSQTLLDEIIDIISNMEFASFNKVGNLILEIGRRLPNEGTHFKEHLKRSINNRPCLPIRYPKSSPLSLKLVAPNKIDGFFLADREYLYREFKDRVPILDFTLEELHSIEALIALFDLDKRRLSSMVQATTSVTGNQSVEWSLMEDLRKKALALYRYDTIHWLFSGTC